MLTRTQHHRLPAAAPSAASQSQQPNPNTATVAAVQASTARLGEMFEMIKQEFETLGQDVNAYRGQRDEYEGKCKCPCASSSRPHALGPPTAWTAHGSEAGAGLQTGGDHHTPSGQMAWCRARGPL